MSEQNLGKKMVEEYHLALFLAAQEHVTGRSLVVVAAGESPDFVLLRPSGNRVGLELDHSWVKGPAA